MDEAMNPGPHSCPYGPPPPDDLVAWEAAWQNHPTIGLGQPWRPAPETDFLAGQVTLGWSDQAWHVLAVLPDRDIHNSARGTQEPCWQTGDVFEIFFRPEGQESYFEIHLTPENHGCRLRFPGTAFRDQLLASKPERTDWFLDYAFSPEGLVTHTRVQREKNRWLAGATLPFAAFLENGDIRPVRPWKTAFCRYDYTRGRDLPILSSTAGLPRPAFHASEHWPIMDFTAA
ncbi:MAG: hypothetical protein SFU85_01920 [Candidatus Methylacidiphilales bacterium]|nr:hypothetical protein [Candidatus Methylacidiphilales bacterium]